MASEAQESVLDHILKLLHHLLGLIKDGSGLWVACFAALAFLVWSWRSYRLITGTFEGDDFGRTSAALVTIVKAWGYLITQPFRAGKAHGLFDCIRLRIEHEIFRSSEHGLSTRRPFGDTTIGDQDTQGEQRRRLNASDVNNAFDRIRKYFATLKKLELDTKELKFLSTLTIETGFVTPLLLLAGLLSRFEQSWPKIVRAYNEDIGDEENHPWIDAVRGADPAVPLWIVAFRKYQKFNFDCWLQWGPSIPNSVSERNDKDLTSIQYGFGDENNSIELVANRKFLKGELEALWQGHAWRSLALPARVQGKITHSHVLSEDEKKDVGEALANAWGTEGRILLQRVDDKSWMIKRSDRGQYYSAYLWVMFVAMLPRAGQPLRPLHPAASKPDQTSHPWLDLLPFFDHCNIACPAALMLVKQQLALKAISGIARIVELAGGAAKFPLRFVFTCAIDEPGDGGAMWLDLLHQKDAHEKNLLTLMRELQPQYPHLFAQGDPIIRLDHYDNASVSDRLYATHELIKHVNAVYGHIEEVASRAPSADAKAKFF